MVHNNHNLFIFIICLYLSPHIHAIVTAQDRQLLDSLSLDEKIGQLLMVAASAIPEAPTKTGQYTESELVTLIERYHIGGIIYLGRSSPEQQLSMTKRLKAFNREHNNIELWVGLDAEWGAAMRVENCVKFPYNLTLGAIADDSLIQELGFMIGEQLKLLGVSINFAPVVDINTNPNNPVINKRSFGQDPTMVAQKAYAYSHGLSEAGIMSCAKHFPGHGDTDIDSHKGLPIINHDARRIKSVELYPFKKLIKKDIPAIMVGHLLLPAFDNQMPATLSRTLTTNLLKKYYHFNGLVITDALDMRGVTALYEPGLIEFHALQAGADLLLVPVDVVKAIARIKKAILEGELSIEEIDAHILKIIHAKTIYAQHEGCSPDQVTNKLNTTEMHALSRKLYQKAITIVCNEHNSIPLAPRNSPLALILIGLDNPSPFATELSTSYSLLTCYLPQTPTESELGLTKTIADRAKTVIIGLSGLSYQPGANFGVSQATLGLIKGLQTRGKQIILVLFGNPYAIALFEGIPGLIEAYEDHPYAQQAAVMVIMGAIKAEGRLPIITT